MAKATALEDLPQLLAATIVFRAFQDGGATLSTRLTLSLVCRRGCTPSFLSLAGCNGMLVGMMKLSDCGMHRP